MRFKLGDLIIDNVFSVGVISVILTSKPVRFYDRTVYLQQGIQNLEGRKNFIGGEKYYLVPVIYGFSPLPLL